MHIQDNENKDTKNFHLTGIKQLQRLELL